MINDDIKSLVEKTNRFFESSILFFDANDYDSTVSRVYYAMFFITETLLLTKNLVTKSHSGLIALFRDHFIKTNIFSKEMGRLLNRAYVKRLIRDYGTSITIDKDETQKILKEGQKFIDCIIKYLEDNKYI